MNWFDLPAPQQVELTETVAHGSSGRIERIVSWGQHTPVGSWYDSSEDEFVLLLAGSAILGWEDGTEQELHPGDSLVIPRHCRHRVVRTSVSPPALWLTVYGDWSAVQGGPGRPFPSR